MKILLIDDSAPLRECLRLRMEQLGHEVWEASCLIEVSQLLLDAQGNTRNGFPVEAAVIDGNFPVSQNRRTVHGLGLLLVDSLVCQGIKAVLYTGDEALLHEAGFLGFRSVRKPGTIAEIMEALE